MSKVCEICGKQVSFGKKYARRGMAKALGGSGQKISGKTSRTFSPNIQKVRALTKNGGVKRMRVCTTCIKKGLVTKALDAGKRKLTTSS